MLGLMQNKGLRLKFSWIRTITVCSVIGFLQLQDDGGSFFINKTEKMLLQYSPEQIWGLE